jgi:hypothetical protein
MLQTQNADSLRLLKKEKEVTQQQQQAPECSKIVANKQRGDERAIDSDNDQPSFHE